MARKMTDAEKLADYDRLAEHFEELSAVSEMMASEGTRALDKLQKIRKIMGSEDP